MYVKQKYQSFQMFVHTCNGKAYWKKKRGKRDKKNATRWEKLGDLNSQPNDSSISLSLLKSHTNQTTCDTTLLQREQMGGWTCWQRISLVTLTLFSLFVQHDSLTLPFNTTVTHQ